MPAIIERMAEDVEFNPQVQFDTLTWGRRQVGVAREDEHLKVELFELFDDPFVKSQFSRRKRQRISIIDKEAFIPTPEDVVVQKLRWARDKDLIDALDVLIVQSPENLDMDYIQKWCGEHGSSERLTAALAL